MEFPVTALEEGQIKVVLVDEDTVRLFWQSQKVADFTSFIAAARYMNHELIIE